MGAVAVCEVAAVLRRKVHGCVRGRVVELDVVATPDGLVLALVVQEPVARLHRLH